MSAKKSGFIFPLIAVLLMGFGPDAFSKVRPVGDQWLNTDVPKEDAICFVLYTVANQTMKMTAQLYPLDEGVDRAVELQVKQDGAWETIARTIVSEASYGFPQADKKRWTAHFRVTDWPDMKDHDYRVLAAGGAAEYTGTIRKDPVNKEEIVVAAFTGNSNKDRRLKPDIIRNIKAQNPDLLFFSGDQSYDHERHQQAWLLFGQQFGEITRDRPTICIPDDHDVGQYNLWGESGAKASSIDGDDGGYFFSPAYVNSVQNAQTWHLPDPYDPTPVRRDIGVYYTSLKIGRFDFAIIEDRKFKTGPDGLVPPTERRPDHVTDSGYDPKTIDVPEAVLLGDRQLKFIEEWGREWNGVDMKCVLSQTIFANAAHRHGKYKYQIVADLDSNGWPQSGRDRALRAIRKSFAVMIGGDQHLATVIQHGVNDFRDSGYSFCVPSIVNYYNRWWTPAGGPEGESIEGPLDHLGDYHDGFGNKLTMHAYANPNEDWENRWGGEWGSRAAGYGLIRMNSATRKITFECWPRGVDVTAKDAEQYPGWPVTIDQVDNYGRTPLAYLPEIRLSGMDDPVVQVIYEPTGEIAYTLRISGNRFEPPVFREGPYILKIGEQPHNMKVLTTIESGKKGSQQPIELSFD